MAFTLNTFKIYDEEYFRGYTEVLAQQAYELNQMNGTMVLENRNMQGELEKASFFEALGADIIIQDRDPTDMSPAEWADLTMGETTGVRIWKTSKAKKAISAFRALGEDPEIMSFVLGQQYGKAVALDFLNTGIAALTGAMQSQPSMVFDATAFADSTFTPEALVRMRGALGDASGNILALVMHSQMSTDYLANAVTSEVSTIAGPAIYSANVGAMRLPIIVTDSDALVEVGEGDEPNVYKVLALTRDALRLTEAQERDILTRTDDSAANLAIQMTTEWSYFVKVKGFEWTGGLRPTRGDLATPGNWEYVYGDPKNGSGVVGLFHARTYEAATP